LHSLTPILGPIVSQLYERYAQRVVTSLSVLPENKDRNISRVIPREKAAGLLQKSFGKVWTKLEDSIAAGFEEFNI
jgi:hypothetical protein